jgi:ssDNA-binding Zn-finger/Zn-ribbon topoisomerase 1
MHRTYRWLWLLLLGALLVSVSYCDTNTTTQTSETSPFLNLQYSVKYVGMDQCKSCHTDIYNSYMQTGMGQSFGLATKEKSAATFEPHTAVYDTANNLYYHPYWQNDSMFVREYRVVDGDTVHSRIQHVSYVIGSGHHTNSHLYNVNGFVFQAPITFYTQEKYWDMAPGFEGGFNSRFSRVIGHECMTCHNGLPEFVEGSVNQYKQVPVGIDCERCHGPGELHVKEKLAGIIVDTTKEADYTIVNPRRLNKDLQMSLCQRCHLQGVAVLQDDKNWDDFKPAMHLKEVMNVYLPRYQGGENDFIMASQADRLRMSQCYLQTEMTCITCHNPHVSVRAGKKEDFNVKCTNCHQSNANAQSQKLCSAPETDLTAANNNCVGCHMPRSGSIDIPHVTITDHNIRKEYKPASTLSVDEVANVRQFIGLECLTDPTPALPNKMEAYLDFYEKYSSKGYVLDSAYKLLQQLKATDKYYLKLAVHYYYLKGNFAEVIKISGQLKPESMKDKWTIYRIGEAHFQQRNLSAAQSYFNRAVQLEPFNLELLNKKASTLALTGKNAEAKLVYEQLLALYPNAKEAYTNLAYLYMLEFNWNQADALLGSALALDPDYEQALINRTILYIELKEKDKARDWANRLMNVNPASEKGRQLLQMIRSI